MPRPKKIEPVKKDIPQILPTAEPNMATVSTTDQSPARETVRSKIGMFYIKAFVYIIAAALFASLICCYTITETKDLLLAISGILSGPLGFIIGFYFKEGSQDKI